jgi:hypothetical protein
LLVEMEDLGSLHGPAANPRGEQEHAGVLASELLRVLKLVELVENDLEQLSDLLGPVEV